MSDIYDIKLPKMPKPYRSAVYESHRNNKLVRDGLILSGELRHPALYTAEQMKQFALDAIHIYLEEDE